ncbi:putative serine/threonine protein kinase [Gordonia soli NBRC 108243]|uniref:non-specific serine/threonine protein kinase n=1 Tax=Gordonia soli NBRC 108243 TaxID=1223545 RepID=M0QN63_9ACTN|nr:putative serine/threonine protein kinase [Gordonia soli NBRC 108243]
MVLKPGSWIAGYRIERTLGSGGMGSVYLAKHPELPRSDALKVLSESVGATEQFRLRFLREAEVAAGLDHPNIVTIYNRGRAEVHSGGDGLLWIAMQYVPGSDCAAEIDAVGRGLDARRVVRIIAETARGVDHAHRRGLLHRDIKPANILLSEIDDDASFDDQRVLLTDFGVAKPTDEVDNLTAVGTVLATLSYASPEQLRGDVLDHRTDQYSLAATAFHLFTGTVPFDQKESAAVISAHLTDPVPRVSTRVAGLSPAVDAVLAKAMAKSPADRFSGCREFSDALTMAVRGGGTVRPSVDVPVQQPQHGVQQGGVMAGRQNAGPAGVPGIGVQGMVGSPVPQQPRHSGPHLPAAHLTSGPSLQHHQTGPRPATQSNAGVVAILVGLVVVAVIVLVFIVAAL